MWKFGLFREVDLGSTIGGAYLVEGDGHRGVHGSIQLHVAFTPVFDYSD